MYQSRAYDNKHGQPVVVLVVTGQEDVSRLIHTLAGRGFPVVEQTGIGQQIVRQVRHHAGGQGALRLLANYGGPDFLTDETIGATP